MHGAAEGCEELMRAPPPQLYDTQPSAAEAERLKHGARQAPTTARSVETRRLRAACKCSPRRDHAPLPTGARQAETHRLAEQAERCRGRLAEQAEERREALLGQAVERWSEAWLDRKPTTAPDRKPELLHGMEVAPFEPCGSKPTSPPPSPPEDAPTTASSAARSVPLNSAPRFAQPPSLHSLAPALNSAPAPVNQPVNQPAGLPLARGAALASAPLWAPNSAPPSVIGVGGGCGTSGGYAAEVHWERPQCVDPAAARQPKPSRPMRATGAEAGAAAPGTARAAPGTAPSATRSTAGARIIPACHPERGFVNPSSPPRGPERCVERNFAASGAGVAGGFIGPVLMGSVAAVGVGGGGVGGGGVGVGGGPMRGREARLGVPHEVDSLPPSPQPAPQCYEPRQPTYPNTSPPNTSPPNTSPPEPPASSAAPTTTPTDEFVSPPRSSGTRSHRPSPGGRSHLASPSDRSQGVVAGGAPGVAPGVVAGTPRAACSLSAQFSVVAPPPNSTLPHASAPPYFASAGAPETEAALARFRETSDRLPIDFREASERRRRTRRWRRSSERLPSDFRETSERRRRTRRWRPAGTLNVRRRS